MHYGFRFLLAAMAVWRITHLLAKEDGPWDAFAHMRRMAPGRLLSCSYCLSVWVAAPFVWFTGGSATEKLVSWWALSGVAVLLEKATEEKLEIKIEDTKESEHELLRAKRRAAGH